MKRKNKRDKSYKHEVVASLNSQFTEAQAVFVADFKGLPMETINVLRGKVRDAGAEFQVAKNTLIKLAAKDSPAAGIEPLMVGNNALGYTKSDPAALAKALADFAKGNEKFVIKGGVLGDKVVGKAQITALAALPSREVLLSTMLGAMQAVPTNFARSLQAIPQKLAYALVAVRDQKAA